MNETKSPSEILKWMKEISYKELPDSLWNSYLWLYGIVLEEFSKVFTDKFDGNQLKGYLFDDYCYAVLSVKNNKTSLYYDSLADNLLFLDETVKNITFDYLCLRKNLFKNYKKKYKCIYQTYKFYINDEKYLQKKESLYVRELTSGDEENIGWYGLAQNISEGYRYFGCFIDGRIVSYCGLARITAFQSELIALNTLEGYRRKGYARSVCSFAVREGLKDGLTVTYTSDSTNTASINNATKLGLILYDTLYTYERQ